MSRKVLSVLAVAAATACSRSHGTVTPPAPDAAASATARPGDGASLVAQMHARYAGKWYRSLSFIQEVYFADNASDTITRVGSHRDVA